MTVTSVYSTRKCISMPVFPQANGNVTGKQICIKMITMITNTIE